MSSPRTHDDVSAETHEQSARRRVRRTRAPKNRIYLTRRRGHCRDGNAATDLSKRATDVGSKSGHEIGAAYGE